VGPAACQTASAVTPDTLPEQIGTSRSHGRRHGAPCALDAGDGPLAAAQHQPAAGQPVLPAGTASASVTRSLLR
jgi:hypothetical protein